MLYYTGETNFNVTALLDDEGNPVERYVYDPYGKNTIFNPDWSAVRSTSGYGNTLTFAGYLSDQITLLLLARERYFHYSLGRWLTRDPIVYLAGSNLFQYVSSRPTTSNDPHGLAEEDLPTTLPEALLVARGKDEVENLQLRACKTFYEDDLRFSKSAVGSYRDFLKHTSDLPKLERASCQAINFICICCEPVSHARFQLQTVSICANSNSVKSKDIQSPSQAICHELVHATQSYPCNLGAVKEVADLSCLDILRFEFMAYRCAGQCYMADGTTVDFAQCARLAKLSAKTHEVCTAAKLEELAGQGGGFLKWATDNRDDIQKGSGCPFQYVRYK